MFTRTASSFPGEPPPSQLVLPQGVNSAQVQGLDFLVLNFKFPHGPFLQIVKVLLNGSSALPHIDHSPQFDIIYKFAESALYVIAQITKEDIKQCQPHC